MGDGKFCDIEEFTQNTSCHGCKYFGNSKFHWVRRILWSLAFICCSGLMGYFIYLNIVRYAEFRMATSISYVNQDDLEFPAITICANDKIKKSYYNIAVLLGEIPPDTLEEYILQQSLQDNPLIKPGLSENEIAQNVLLLNEEYKNKKQSFDWSETYLKGGHQYEEIFQMFTLYNFQRVKRRVNSFIMERERGLCHTVTFYTEDGSPLRSNQYDFDKGLLQFLEYDITEHRGKVFESPGFFLMIHSPSEIPTPSPYNMLIHGRGYHIEIKPTYHTIENHQLLTLKECQDTQNEDFVNPLKHYSNYSHHACLKECQSEVTIESCKCYNQGYPEFESPVCKTKEESDCTIYADYDRCKRCLPVCNRTKYEVNVMEIPQDSSPVAEGDSTLLNIQFEEFAYTEVKQYPEFPPEEFFAEVGGHLGLFLGAGILTFGEIFDFIFTCGYKSKKVGDDYR